MIGRATTFVLGLLVAGVVSTAADPSATADPQPTLHWVREANLAAARSVEMQAAQTPHGRGVVAFAVPGGSPRAPKWTVSFRAQTQNGWTAARRVATFSHGTRKPTFASAVSDDRVISVLSVPDEGSANPRLWLREQTFAGKALFTQYLGRGRGPDVAVDPQDDVAVVRHIVTPDGESEVGGWTVSPRGAVVPGTMAAATIAGDVHNTFPSVKVAALGDDLFAVGYIDYWYFADEPDQITSGAEAGTITGTFWNGSGGLDLNGHVNRIAIAAHRGSVLMAAGVDPGTSDGLSRVETSTYEPSSWTPALTVSTYTAPDPRLDTNVIYAATGQAAAVTDRAYLADGIPRTAWDRGPRVPVRINRCGFSPSSTFGYRGVLHWFAATPTASGGCALGDFALEATS